MIRSIPGPLLSLVLCIFLCSGFGQERSINAPADLVPLMLESSRNIKTLTYKLKNTERIDGKLLTGEQKIKLTSEPFKCYIYLVKPSSGSEVLYVDGQNDGEAIYNPNGFPYAKLNLDPLGSLMRKNNHHTIFEVGFNYISGIIDRIYRSHPEYFELNGETIWNGIRCYRLSANIADYKLEFYTTKAGDTVEKIASNRGINAYKIIELNEEIDGFGEVKAGIRIQLPNYYAKSMELFVDQDNFLPVYQKISDELGLFELYEFTGIEVNPKIPDTQFTSEQLGKKM